jgi:hypothetical protein
VVNSEISEELDIAMDRLHSEAEAYRFADELLLQFRGYCIGFVRAYRDRLADEHRILRDYANFLLQGRGGQEVEN